MNTQIRFYTLFLWLFLLGSCGADDTSGDATGVFEATEVVVSSEASGRILWLEVREGAEIPSGHIVGVVDSTTLYLQKQQLLATIRAAGSRRPDIQAQVAVLEEQLVVQKREQARFTELLRANAANRKQLDDIEAQIAVLEKQLRALKSNLFITDRGITADVETLEVQVAQANDRLEKCRVVNPVRGTVLAKYAEQGEVTAPGKPLYKIANTDTLMLRAYLLADQMTRVQLGQEVLVYADYGAESLREYRGVIEWISEKSEFTPKTIQTRDERQNLVYATKIAVPNDGFLKIGMYGEVKLFTE